MKSRSPSRNPFAATPLPLACVVAFSIVQSASATDYTWTAASDTSNWSTSTNWSPNGTMSSGDTAILDGTATSNRSPDQNTGLTFEKILFKSTAGQAYTPGFGAWTVSGASTTTFIEVESGNDYNNFVNPDRGSTPLITLKSGDNTILNNGGGTLTISSSSTYSGNAIRANGSGNSKLIVDGSGTTYLATGSNEFFKLADNGSNVLSLQKDGAGTLFLETANTYSGSTTVNNGVLRITHGDALGTANTTSTGGNLNTGRVELAGGITTGETFAISMRQGDAIDAPALSNFSGNNKITGEIKGYTGGSRINIESQAGLLTLEGNLYQASGTGSRTWQLMGAGDGLVSGIISNGTGTLAIIKKGAGTWTLSNTNTYTGSTNINDGTLALAGGSAIADSGAVTLANTAGATLRLDASETIGSLAGGGSSGGNVNLQGNTLTVGDTNNKAFDGVISGSGGGLTKQGTGTLTLSGANTYTGATTVTDGTLNLLGDQSAATGSIHVGPSSTYNSTMTIGAADQTANTSVVVNAGNFVRLGSAASGTGISTLNVHGSAANPTTVINNGTLLASRRSLLQINTDASWTQNGDAELKSIGGYGDTLTVDGGSFTYAGTADFAINPAVNNTGSATLNIQNAGNFTTGVGFAFGSAGTGSGIASINLSGGGKLTLSDDVTSLVGGAATGKVRLGTSGGVIDTAGFATELSYEIENITAETGSLTKTGSGTLTLTGASTYTGTTTVNEGTLVINGDNSSATGDVSVASGATLGGSGTVGGAATISGTHAAGNNGVGLQSFSSSLTYAANSIFEWDLSQSSTSTGFDTVSATGNIDVNTTGTVFKVVLGGTALTDIVNTGNAFWNTPYGTQTWNMSDIFGKAFNSGAFQSVDTNTDVSSFGSFTITGGGSTLTWTAVPEPTSALAGLLLASGLLRRRRAQA